MLLLFVVFISGCNDSPSANNNYNPPAGRVEIGLAQEAEAEGNYELAIELYTKAIEKNPEFGAAFTARGWRHHAMNNDAAALSDLTEAIRLGAECYYFRAEVNQALGNIEEAKQDYELAIDGFSEEIADGEPDEGTYSGRATCYKHLGKYDLAIEDFKSALKISSDDAIKSEIEELEKLQSE